MAHPTLAFFGLGAGELLLALITVLFLVSMFVVGSAVVAYLVIRSLSQKPGAPPAVKRDQTDPTIPGAKQTPQHANLAGSQFHDTNLAGADFENVNLATARFHNADLSNATFSAVQIGGATFKHVGPPPGEDGKRERQRPVRFEEMMLCDSTFQKVDFSNARLTDCDLTGMTINGILVTDLIAAYQGHQRPS